MNDRVPERDRTGHEKWLIYCPQINPSTLLHLNIQGTSYALRDFSGDANETSRSRPGRPFKARDRAGKIITVTDEFKRQISFERKLNVYDNRVAVTRAKRWHEIISRAAHDFEICPSSRGAS
ncbi:hypothetical protein ACLQ2Q_15860 [Microbacterium sp. DT81.1]|uniref:hypothetical protein n=1 Tax=Microbacterium sp. DT81.1 TaxID=3393413 RepID=UPI003CF2CE56